MKEHSEWKRLNRCTWTRKLIAASREWLVKGRKPRDIAVTSSTWRSLKSKLTNAEFRGDDLVISIDGCERVVVAREDADAVLSKLYRDPATSRAGRDSFFSIVFARYVGISRRTVDAFLKAQAPRQIVRKPHVKKSVARPIVSNYVGNRWQIDLIDMTGLAGYNRGYKWILTCIDHFSKYLWTRPCYRKNARNVLAAFKEIARDAARLRRARDPRFKGEYDLPTLLQSDRGKEFANAEFRRFIEPSGTEQILSAPYHPQSQGCIERANGTLKSSLYHQFRIHPERRKKWFDPQYEKSLLAAVTRAINDSRHSTTGRTPRAVYEGLSTPEYVRVVDKTARAARRMITHEDKTLPAIRRGDIVRLLKTVESTAAARQGAFRKSYVKQWTAGTYEVVSVSRPKSSTQLSYKVRSLKTGTILRRSLFRRDLQRVSK